MISFLQPSGGFSDFGCCMHTHLLPKVGNLNFNKFFYVKCSKTNSTIRKYRWGGFIPVLPSLASSFILRLKGFNKNDVHNRGKLEETFKKSSEVCAKRTGVRGKRQAPRPTPSTLYGYFRPARESKKKILENKNRGLQTV